MDVNEKEVYLILRGWYKLSDDSWGFFTHPCRNKLKYGDKYYAFLTVTTQEALELEGKFGNLIE
jgi:hypothetical protein